MITSLFFTVLGYVVLEASNFICPPKHRRSEKLLLTGAVALGAFIFLLSARLFNPEMQPADFQSSFQNLTWPHIWVLAKAAAAGTMLVLMFRIAIFPAARWIFNRLPGRFYFGELMVWELVVDHITKSARWVTVFTKDGRIYEGEMQTAPSVPGDRDVYLRNCQYAKLDAKGRQTPFKEYPGRPRFIFIPASEIVKVEVFENQEVDSRWESLKAKGRELRSRVTQWRSKLRRPLPPAETPDSPDPTVPHGDDPTSQLNEKILTGLTDLTLDFEDLKKRVLQLETDMSSLRLTKESNEARSVPAPNPE